MTEHRFVKRARLDLADARKKLSMANESKAIADRNVAQYQEEVRKAEYDLMINIRACEKPFSRAS